MICSKLSLKIANGVPYQFQSRRAQKGRLGRQKAMIREDMDTPRSWQHELLSRQGTRSDGAHGSAIHSTTDLGTC